MTPSGTNAPSVRVATLRGGGICRSEGGALRRRRQGAAERVAASDARAAEATEALQEALAALARKIEDSDGEGSDDSDSDDSADEDAGELAGGAAKQRLDRVQSFRLNFDPGKVSSERLALGLSDAAKAGATAAVEALLMAGASCNTLRRQVHTMREGGNLRSRLKAAAKFASFRRPRETAECAAGAADRKSVV